MAKEISPIIDASFLIDNPKRIIPVSPAIDLALSGKVGCGIEEGSWVLLSGKEKSGKTTTALQIAANAQDLYGKEVFIGNVEGRLSKRNLEGIHNLDARKVKLVQSTLGNILSAEDHVNEYVNIIKEHPGCVLVVDSTSALCDASGMDEKITATRRNSGPKLLAEFCRYLGQIVPIQNSVVILIQHIIANTGNSAKYSPFTESGGNKIQYQADTKMVCMSFKHRKVSEDSAAYGQEVNWKVHTSSLGAPGAKFTSYIRYGYGIDDVMELITIAADLSIIQKGKSGWYTMLDESKVQGDEKARSFLLENQFMFEEIKNKVNEMLC